MLPTHIEQLQVEAGMLPTQNEQKDEAEPMATLSDEVKAFIVRSLARYETPLNVADAVMANFGIKVERQQVFAFDPAGSRPPAQRWRDLHAATRQAFLRDVAEIGVAQKAVRLAMLDRMARDAMSTHAYSRAAGFLEQAAKECGGLFDKGRSVATPADAPPKEAAS
jgi:hypothetical protein